MHFYRLFYLVHLRATLGSSQGILLVLCSVIIPGDIPGTNVVLKIKPELVAGKTNILPNALSLWHLFEKSNGLFSKQLVKKTKYDLFVHKMEQYLITERNNATQCGETLESVLSDHTVPLGLTLYDPCIRDVQN